MRMNVVVAFLAVALLGDAPFAIAQTMESGWVKKTGRGVVRISGMVTPDVAKSFDELISEEIKEIELSSEGGVTESALRIAELIQKRRLPVKVLDVCLSSCANYLFVAGYRREIMPGAVVGWHGGHSFKPFRSGDSEKLLKEKEEILLREQLLYARARVSTDLIVYSGLITLGRMDPTSLQVGREYDLWTPSVREMRRLGLKTIAAEQVRTERAVESDLGRHGFAGLKVYVGNLHTKIPNVLSQY